MYIYTVFIYFNCFFRPVFGDHGGRPFVNCSTGRFAFQVLDLFDEALEPSLSVAFDGTDSTPCLDARQICCCVDFLKISVYDRKYMVVFDINIAHVVFDINIAHVVFDISISVKNISIHIVYCL